MQGLGLLMSLLGMKLARLATLDPSWRPRERVSQENLDKVYMVARRVGPTLPWRGDELDALLSRDTLQEDSIGSGPVEGPFY